eukprot:TRINITY_DN1773_c0_g1_i1.p1 TRINITY_DN1773_c0_g1~~TRINITY_DN1773_c0_g1_i1.p1  ORF type:complete len:111 (+),score=24.91 TRINITY_DN1773_c0_g1_i1:68-400(+)
MSEQVPSERKLSYNYQKCAASSLLQSAIGAGIGATLGFLLFRQASPRMFMTGLGSGLGLGASWNHCSGQKGRCMFTWCCPAKSGHCDKSKCEKSSKCGSGACGKSKPSSA